MGWTKLQLVQKALGQIGYASYIYDLQPEQLEDVCSTMEAMIGTWYGQGIRIGYNMASSPAAQNINGDSGLIDAANETVYMNVAVKIAGKFGKQLPAQDIMTAKTSYNALLNKAISRNTVPMQYPNTLPLGAGNKYWRTPSSPFVQPPQEPLTVGPDDTLEDLTVT